LNTELTVPTEQSIVSTWYEPDMRGMRVSRVPTWDEWKGGIAGLSLLQHALPMIIGDYINVGEDTFGEKFEQALEIFGDYSYGTVANYASIMRSVPYSRRTEGLTMAHYKAVRSLTPEEQVALQEQAKELGWNSIELWDKAHGTEPTLISMLDDLIEEVGLLYSHTPTSIADDYVAETQRQLQGLKTYVEAYERANQARLT